MERSAKFGESVRRLFEVLGRERTRLALVAVCAVSSVALNVVGPLILGHATDVIVDGVTGSDGGVDFGALRSTLLLAISCTSRATLLQLASAWMITGLVQRTMLHLREQAERKIHALPLAYIDRQQRGDLLSRVTNDLDNLAQSLQQTLSQMLTSVLLLVGVTVMMFTISWQLALVALITVPISLFGMKKVAARARPKFLAQWGSTGALNAQIEEAFTGHAVVKAFGRQHDVEERFRRTNESLYESSFGAQFMSSLMQPLTFFLGNVQYVLVAVVGGLQVSSGAISVGDVQAFIQYARNFSMPLTQLASMMNVFQSGIASLERVLELLDTDEQSADPPLPATLPPVAGRVGFEDVTFSYAPDVPPHRAPLARRRARRDGGDRRAHRRRQDDARQPDHAVLRARRRPHHARRPRHRDDEPARAAVAHRHGAPGHLALRGHDPRQHRLRPSRRDRTTRSSPRRRRPTSTASCTTCPTATTRSSTRRATTSAPARSSW